MKKNQKLNIILSILFLLFFTYLKITILTCDDIHPNNDEQIEKIYLTDRLTEETKITIFTFFVALGLSLILLWLSIYIFNIISFQDATKQVSSLTHRRLEQLCIQDNPFSNTPND